MRKGEKSTTIYFFKRIAVSEDGVDDAPEDPTQAKVIPILRSFRVFHASQIEGIPPYQEPDRGGDTFESFPAAETLLTNSGATIRHGGPKAFYAPQTDHIQLPVKEAFSNPEAYYTTALHELGHWTGGREDRVPRNMKGRFGSDSYAREELRAELASAFLSAELGIRHELQSHADYIASWLEVLKQDNHEIFRAASDAQKIADFCLAFRSKSSPLVEGAKESTWTDRVQRPIEQMEFRGFS